MGIGAIIAQSDRRGRRDSDVLATATVVRLRRESETRARCTATPSDHKAREETRDEIRDSTEMASAQMAGARRRVRGVGHTTAQLWGIAVGSDLADVGVSRLRRP